MRKMVEFDHTYQVSQCVSGFPASTAIRKAWAAAEAAVETVADPPAKVVVWASDGLPSHQPVEIPRDMLAVFLLELLEQPGVLQVTVDLR